MDLGLKKYNKNGMIKDIEQERDITERWYAGEYAQTMKLSTLIEAAKFGIGECDETCLSREISGEGNCMCVRSIFTHPEFYMLYTRLRQMYVTGRFVSLVNEALGDMNADK